MKSIIGILLCICCFYSQAQQRFIRTNARTDFGGTLRILPASGNGWVILSIDSMNISKYNSCGSIEWNKKYNIPNEHPLLVDFIRSKSGGYILMTRILNGQLNACLITRIDDSGNIVWSKSYDDNYFDQFGYTLNEDSFGNIFIHVNHSHTNGPYFNAICKLNNNGNILWVKQYEFMTSTWGGATVTSDNGMIVRNGNVIGKLDFNGNIEWTYVFHSPNTYHYYAPMEVSDGYIFTKSQNGAGNFIFYKIDRQGIPVANSVWFSSFKGTRPIWKTKQNGNISILFNFAHNGKNYPVIVEIDKDLNVLYQGSIGIDLYAADFCFNNASEAIITGYNNSSNVFIAKLDDLYKTSCDTLLPLMTMSRDTLSTSTISSGVFPYNLIEKDHTFTTTDFSDSVNTICSVPLALNIGRDTLLCQFSQMTLRNNLLGLFDEYLWSTGETTPYITINEPGLYWVTARHHCEDSMVTDSILIADDEPLVDFLGDDRFECAGNSIVLNAPDCNCIYKWQDGSSQDSIVITDDAAVSLTIIKNDGCQYEDHIIAEFSLCDCFFYVPNAFTPNNDGQNEIFKPVYECEINDYEISIFNRWNQMVYHSTDINEGWNSVFNSEKAEQGVYNYIIKYQPIISGKKLSPINKFGSLVILY